MSFNPTSFFAGVGTVFIAIAVGFGTGVTMTAATQKPDGPNRLERITSASAAVPPAATAPERAAAPPAAAAAVAAENTPRRIDQPPATVTADTSSFQPPQVEPAAMASAPAETRPSPVPGQASESGKAGRGGKSAERNRRAERRTNEQRKWVEHKRPQRELADIAGARGEPVVLREVLDEEERAPRYGFFGQD